MLKIWRYSVMSNFKWKIFFKFCGLLRKSKLYIFILHLLENFSKIISGRMRDISSIRMILITQIIIIQYSMMKKQPIHFKPMQWCLSKMPKHHWKFVNWAAQTSSQNSRVCYYSAVPAKSERGILKFILIFIVYTSGMNARYFHLKPANSFNSAIFHDLSKSFK